MSYSAGQLHTLRNAFKIMARILAIVDAQLHGAAIVIIAAIPEVELEIAAIRNIGEGDGGPGEALLALLSNLPARTDSRCSIVDELNVLEVGFVAVGHWANGTPASSVS